MAIERLLTGSIQNQIQELMSTEDLVIEAFRDLVKDELKSHIRAKVDDDPELKAEIKEAVAYYFHSKARSIYAELKATRAATRLGLRLLDELQGGVGEALGPCLKKNLSALERRFEGKSSRIGVEVMSHWLLACYGNHAPCSFLCAILLVTVVTRSLAPVKQPPARTPWCAACGSVELYLIEVIATSA